MKPLYTIAKDCTVGIYDAQYVARFYTDKIIVVSPCVKWAGNTGGYAETKNSIRDAAAIAKITKEGLDHGVATAFQIASAFIPVLGPFISAGIGLLDAAQYHKEGKKTEAGIVALFSILPGLGKVVQKIPGITQLGEKGMVALGNKLITKQALNKVEQRIVNSIGTIQPLIKSEASQQIKSLASNAMNKVTNVSNKKLFHVFAEKGLEHQLSHSASGVH